MQRVMCVVVSGLFATVATIAAAGAGPARSTAEPARSTGLAVELTELLTARGLDAIATVDPETPDRFVAALAFPKVQLLVVGSTYPVPALMLQQIAAKQYRDAYIALQQTNVADGKVFFQDLGGDGLRGVEVDVLYENVVNQTVFDGAPEKHNVTKAAYDQKFAAADALYSRLLTLLIKELKSTTTQ
jgi:hypothetical protein